MLETAKISEIARQVAGKRFEQGSVERVISEPATDSNGNEALRITLVLRPNVVRKLSGDSVLDTLVDIRRNLQSAGEDRLAIIEYATQAELDAGGDPQS